MSLPTSDDPGLHYLTRVAGSEARNIWRERIHSGNAGDLGECGDTVAGAKATVLSIIHNLDNIASNPPKEENSDYLPPALMALDRVLGRVATRDGETDPFYDGSLAWFKNFKEQVSGCMDVFAAATTPVLKCDYCGESGVVLKKCSACKSVAYCSKEHQKAAWKEHKAACRAVTARLKTVAEKGGGGKSRLRAEQIRVEMTSGSNERFHSACAFLTLPENKRVLRWFLKLGGIKLLAEIAREVATEAERGGAAGRFLNFVAILYDTKTLAESWHNSSVSTHCAQPIAERAVAFLSEEGAFSSVLRITDALYTRGDCDIARNVIRPFTSVCSYVDVARAILERLTKADAKRIGALAARPHPRDPGDGMQALASQLGGILAIQDGRLGVLTRSGGKKAREKKLFKMFGSYFDKGADNIFRMFTYYHCERIIELKRGMSQLECKQLAEKLFEKQNGYSRDFG